MSDPVYRIDVEHRPMDGALVPNWYATVRSIAQDEYLSGSGQYGDSADEAVVKAQAWIAAEQTRQEGFSVFTDENGDILYQHSVES